MHTRELKKCLGIAGFTICVGAPACATSDTPDMAVPSWEEFRRYAERSVDGHSIYVVEWDLAVTLEELRDYYDQRVAHPNIGVAEQASTVNVVNGHDDIWTNDAQRHLTYCISNDFGSLKARVIDEMASATRSWEGVGNVSFRH